MAKRSIILPAMCLLVTALVSGSAALAQPSPTEVTVPMTVKGLFGEKTIHISAVEYRPEGGGPFPAVVLSHGGTTRANERVAYTATYPVASALFVKWGFAVLNPLRRGYGRTGGVFEEDFGRCENPFYVEAGLETAKDIAAAVAYVRRQAFVDPDRIVLVGQSVGGWGSLALASRRDVPIRGVVNFAGGHGGKHKSLPNNNCEPDRLVAAAATLGKTTTVPSLWLYTANDQYFGPELSRRMYDAYASSGGRATYHLLPAFGEDGHGLIRFRSGVSLWQDKVEAFFREIGALPSR
jgi:dienelactone hydrolase